jgi:hypothetical protein
VLLVLSDFDGFPMVFSSVYRHVWHRHPLYIISLTDDDGMKCWKEKVNSETKEKEVGK